MRWWVTLVVAPSIAACAYDPPQTATSSHFRKLLTIDGTRVAGPLTDFPVLISLTDSDLQTTAQTDGADVRFTAADGTTTLSHELEGYDAASGTLLAWVKVPALASPADTDLFVHYGEGAGAPNPIGTWSNGFVAVWHLSGDPGGAAPQIADSAQANHGTATGAQQSPGQVGGSLLLDGNDDLVDAESATPLDNITDKTASGWVRPTTGHDDTNNLFAKNDGGDEQTGWNFYVNRGPTGAGGSPPRSRLGYNHGHGGDYGEWHTPDGSVADDTTHHVAVVYHRGGAADDPVLYVDGVALVVTERRVPQQAAVVDDKAHPVILGRGFAGMLDELRIANVARPMEWLATEHTNQRDPAAFLRSIGDEENVP